MLFAYGPVDRYRELVEAKGFREEEFWMSAPHSHPYWSGNDVDEDRMIEAHEWRWYPLQPHDDWGGKYGTG